MHKFAYPIALAYCAENQDIASAIESDLASICDFTHFKIERDQKDNLTSLLKDFGGPILLLVSDNFLRSTKCMEQGLVQVSEKEDQLLPIVTPGYRLDEKGNKEEINTSFERVSDIIQYINYWQDRYLELRRQKREDPALDNEGFADHLKRVRAISGEVGEHIRLLRSLPYLSLDSLKHNSYTALFEFLDEEEIGEAYAASFESEETSPAAEVSETIAQTVVEAEEEVEEPAIDLASIPGMDMLDNTITEEVAVTAEKEETIPPPEETISEVEEKLTEDTETPIEPEQEPEVAEEKPRPVAEILDQAWSLVDQEKAQEAMELLAASATERPHDSQLRYNYALLLAQENHHEAATQEVMSVLTLAPKMEDALFLAGELADIRQDGEQAKQYFKQVVSLRPAYSEAWLQLGFVSMTYEPENRDAAINYLQKAIKSSDDGEASYQLALLYLNDPADTKKARKYFKKTIERDPSHPMVHYDLAVLQHSEGDYTGALASYEQAVLLNSKLKTAENDAAFKLMAQKSVMATEKATIEALKQQVAQLEQQLASKTEVSEESKPSTSQQKSLCVLITGATSGIGKATAIHFAKEGHRLIITGRRKSRLTALRKEWQDKYGVEVKALSFDVRDPKAVAKAIEKLPKKWSDIDILINNAGKAKGFDPIHEGDLEHWEEMIDTNLKGLLYLTRAVSPGMVARGSGHIINVASTAGKEVYPNGNVYCATKFAVDALTKSMRLDLHKHNVRVSQVAPAHVEETEFAVVRFDGDTERAKIYNDFQPLTSPDVAASIFFIATQPAHVNILDIVLQGTQQASSTVIDRSGRAKYALIKEEE